MGASTRNRRENEHLRYEEMLDHARGDAVDVVAQWRGVDIDRANIETELRAHWSANAPLTESPKYIALVAREIERIYTEGDK